jgi:hypothetical protein
MDTTALQLTQIAAGFAGGAVFATILNTVAAWYRRPVVEVRLVDNAGCYVETKRGDPPTRDAKYLRLRVRNAGRSSVKACQAYLVRIVRREGGRAVNDAREVVDLGWAHRGVGPRDIPVGAFFYLDVASIELIAGGSDRLMIGESLPNNLSDLLIGPAQFELHVLVASDNAEPISKLVKFGFDQSKPELSFGYD